MSFAPSIRELQVRLQRCRVDVAGIAAELTDAGDVLDRHGGDGTPLRSAAQCPQELLQVAQHLSGWCVPAAAGAKAATKAPAKAGRTRNPKGAA